MKRERIEDLGRISELLKKFFIDHEKIFYECDSKHAEDQFIANYKDEEKLSDIFHFIRAIKWDLDEIHSIALGYDDEI